MDEQGWLNGVERRPSPNFNQRPAGVAIDLLVIHAISLPPGEFGGPWIDALFQNRLEPDAHPYFAGMANLRVSSHLLIRRDGRLIQYVPLMERAWHAGRSQFAGRPECNDFSIGVELEGTDFIPFTGAQYASLIRLTHRLRHLFPGIGPGRIQGHSDIAPGRKTDPGPYFDWPGYLTAIGDRPESRTAALTSAAVPTPAVPAESDNHRPHN